jgi:hypothetical protein
MRIVYAVSAAVLVVATLAIFPYYLHLAAQLVGVR